MKTTLITILHSLERLVIDGPSLDRSDILGWVSHDAEMLRKLIAWETGEDPPEFELDECPECGGEGIVPLSDEEEQALKDDAEYYRVTGEEPVTMNECPECGGDRRLRESE